MKKHSVLRIFAETEIKDALEVPELTEKLRDKDYEAKVERAVILHVKAFDWNCPQHITPHHNIDEIKAMVQPMNDYIEKLEKEIALLKAEKL